MRKYKGRLTLGKAKEVMNDFLVENYGIELDIPVEWGIDLERKWGSFLFKEVDQDIKFNGVSYEKGNVLKGSLKIVLNRELIHAKNKDLVNKILKHEALHYAMYKKGVPFDDGDVEFEKEIERKGLVGTRVSRRDLQIK